MITAFLFRFTINKEKKCFKFPLFHNNELKEIGFKIIVIGF